MNNVRLDTHGRVWGDNGGLPASHTPTAAQLRGMHELHDEWDERLMTMLSKDKSLPCTND
jgi:hypothetical protein